VTIVAITSIAHALRAPRAPALLALVSSLLLWFSRVAASSAASAAEFPRRPLRLITGVSTDDTIRHAIGQKLAAARAPPVVMDSPSRAAKSGTKAAIAVGPLEEQERRHRVGRDLHELERVRRVCDSFDRRDENRHVLRGHPAMMALTAITSTLARPFRGGSIAISSSALRPEAATNVASPSGVAGMIGKPSVQPCSYAYSKLRLMSCAIVSDHSCTRACATGVCLSQMGTAERAMPCGRTSFNTPAIRA
jgi:hypothetical protein